MRKIQSQGPYYIGGYSLGGEIAFEMAQQLVSHGQLVNLLVMFDTRNPKRSIRQMTRTNGGSINPKFDEPLLSGRLDVLKRKLMGHYVYLSVLNPIQRTSYLFNQIGIRIKRATIAALVMIYRMLGKRLPDYLLLRYLRESHSEAKTNYAPMVYPGKVTLFRAKESLADNPDNSPMGWEPLVAGGLEVYHFDASHEMMRVEYARDVASRLNDCLIKARGE
jgi:thioesterase domain-containing protein